MSVHPLLERSPFEVDGGNLIGRDPRTLDADEFTAHLPDAVIGMRAIRLKCLDCSNTFTEVRKCTVHTCPLWPLRMGSLPKGLRAARKAEADGEAAE